MGLFDWLRRKPKPSSATYRPPAKKKIPVTQPKKTERSAPTAATHSQDDTSNAALTGLLFGDALHDSHTSHDSGDSSMHHSSDSGYSGSSDGGSSHSSSSDSGWSGGGDSGGGSFGGGGDF